MSEQEQGNTIGADGVTYNEAHFEAVRRARHAVRKALSKFSKVVSIVETRDEGIANALRATRKAHSAMRGRPGFTQEEQVQRFDWTVEDIETALEALGNVSVEDEFDAKALSLATEYLSTAVRAKVDEGRAIAADRDYESYKAAKDAYNARKYASTYSGYETSEEDVEPDETGDDED